MRPNLPFTHSRAVGTPVSATFPAKIYCTINGQILKMAAPFLFLYLSIILLWVTTPRTLLFCYEIQI
jgi:hypothetical protein